ncbi:helix-turn-helix domain-containing protein [Geomonas nitrogeniifigens]|uniref:XRE family transcriptional regulator n=1 Tax=Geomonas diazotrophica TaxID=2843197 RepID=UPI001C2C5D1E|nr:XRE family transcriptional regulator [Geomonas nitrogeniifigens]QXE85555.1 helix-turn-helix domain-containing protein [Geomonas nitrogeniifigens]
MRTGKKIEEKGKATIGKRIAEKRKAAKLTQTALADAVDVTTAFISQIESDHRKPSYGILVKLAHALGINVESFFGDTDLKTTDPVAKIVLQTVPLLEEEKKKKLLEQIFRISGTKFFSEFPFLTSAVEYAQFIIREFKVNVPVDVYRICSNLGVDILYAELDGKDGLLYKNSEAPLIVLSTKLRYKERERFTIAIFLGHLIIPWHVKQVFSRGTNQRSLETEDQFDIEAREFAGELLLPGEMVRKDLARVVPSIEVFERLAKERYQCAMTALAHKFSEYYGSKAVYVTSKGGEITRKYDIGFKYSLRTNISEGSVAHSFIMNPPTTKETRTAVVQAKIWFEDAPPKLEVVEESMLDPDFGVTVSLIRLK